MIGVLKRESRRRFETDTCRQESHAKMKAEIGVTLSQAQEGQSYLKLEEAGKDASLKGGALGGA